MTILYIPVIRMLTILIKEVYTNVLVAPDCFETAFIVT